MTMNIKNYFILLGILCIAISCSNKSQQQNEEELKCSCPHATTTFNNYTINTMNNDGSGRWVDKWDFPIDLGRTIIIGDTIPASR